VRQHYVLTPFRGDNHDHRRCIDSAIAAAESACARRGLHLTRLRRRVLEVVWSSHRPVKAYQILANLQRDRGTTAPPTVYRALDFLQEAGLVHRIESLSAFVGCGDPASPHVAQFLICKRCCAVAELGDSPVTRALAREVERLGFDAGRKTIEVEGICPDCGARPDAGPRSAADNHETPGDPPGP
jgi:Fur family zinc uptake transcriptional regulator